MGDIADVAPAVVGRLRVICGELPEAYEEQAWIGLRWRIRRRTFLHVYTTDGRGSAYIDMDDPAILMTFRAPPGELAALAHAGPPFFRADWGVNVVGMVLDDETDWVEVAELVTDSYRVQAPRRFAGAVHSGRGRLHELVDAFAGPPRRDIEEDLTRFGHRPRAR